MFRFLFPEILPPLFPSVPHVVLHAAPGNKGIDKRLFYLNHLRSWWFDTIHPHHSSSDPGYPDIVEVELAIVDVLDGKIIATDFDEIVQWAESL